MTDDDATHLRLAIELATESAATDGGPFGALVVLEGAVVGRGANRVTAEGDPTLHAEVVAIRDACARVGRHDLSGAVLYTSCEPCAMCFGAAWWARIDRIVFAADRADAAAAGFDDAAIFADVAAPPAERVLLTERLELPEAGEPFAAWAVNPARIPYRAWISPIIVDDSALANGHGGGAKRWRAAKRSTGPRESVSSRLSCPCWRP